MPRRSFASVLVLVLLTVLVTTVEVVRSPEPAHATATLSHERVSLYTNGTSAPVYADFGVPYVSSAAQHVGYTGRLSSSVWVNHPLVLDRDSGVPATVLLKSDGSGTGSCSGGSLRGMSADGSRVLFSSTCDLTGDGLGAFKDRLFVRDIAASQTLLVSSAVGNTLDAYLSAAGDHVVVTTTLDLTSDSSDTNGVHDVYRLPVVSGAPVRVTPNGGSISNHPISADGNRIAYMAGTEVWVWDWDGGSPDTYRISEWSGSAVGGSRGSISPSGNLVGFETKSSSLLGYIGTITVRQVAVRRLITDSSTGDISLGDVTWVSQKAGVPANYDTFSRPTIAISADDRAVVFVTAASNLLFTSDANSFDDVYHANLMVSPPTLRRVSDDHTGGDADKASWNPDISVDGRFVAFTTAASDILSDNPNGSANDHVLTDMTPAAGIQDWEETARRSVGDAELGTDATHDEADPVNTLTGAYTTSTTDAALPGIGIPAEISRTYSSGSDTVGVFGRGWTTLLDAHVDDATTTAVVQGVTGQRATFTADGTGGYATAGSHVDMTGDATNGWTLVDRRDLRTTTYNPDGSLASVVDRNGNGVTITRDLSGTPTAITDAAGRGLALTFGTSGISTGRLVTVELPDLRTVSYTYVDQGDGTPLLSTITATDGGVTTIAHTDSGDTPAPVGLIEEVVDGNSNRVVLNTYDADGRVTAQLDDEGHGGTFSWDPLTTTSTYTDARGNTKTDTYRYGLLAEQTDGAGGVTTYEWDTDLRLVATVDADGNRTEMTYTADGQLASRTVVALSYSETFTYTDAADAPAPEGLLETHTGFDGRTTTHTYDGAGNLTETSKLLAGTPVTVTNTYDGDGRLATTTDARGKTTTLGYDVDHQLISTTTPEGSVTTFGYDTSGRRTTVVDPRGNVSGATPADYTTTFTYDDADRVLTTTDPLGAVTAATYDLAGNRTTTTDANSNTTSFAYDGRNLLTAVTAPDLSTTSYVYDGVRNLTSRTDANSHVTTYSYTDPRDLLTKVTTPTGDEWTYGYDVLGRRTSTTDAIGNASSTVGDGVTTVTYDALGRMTAVDYADTSTPDVTFTFDAASNRTSMVDGAGTVTYDYDDLDRLVELVRNPSDPTPAARTLAWSYDAGGNVLSRSHPDGTSAAVVTTYSYDDDSRLATVGAAAGTTTYSYDAAGGPVGVTFPNGAAETRTYDRAGRLDTAATVEGGLLPDDVTSADYVRDLAGNPTSLTTLAGVESYLYDDLDRLTKVCYGSPCNGSETDYIGYTYDPVGNRLTEVRPAGTTTYTYDDADRLTALSGLVSDTVSWDANGQQLSDGSRTYTYDAAGRMATVDDGTDVWSYSYDGDSQRLSNTNGGTGAADGTSWLWDPVAPLPVIVDVRDGTGGHVEQATIGTGLDIVGLHVGGTDVGGVHVGGTNVAVHLDGIGSVAGLTDTAGETARTRSYEPFGTPRTNTALTLGAPDTTFGFTGGLDDDVSGLLHLRAREYAADTGRFTRTDPVAPMLEDPYVASYVYVANQPGVFTDPSGMVAVGGCVSAMTALGASIGGDACGVFAVDFSRILKRENPFSVGALATGKAGAATPGAEINFGVMLSTAGTVEDMPGRGAYAFADVGAVLGAGVDAGWGRNCSGGHTGTLTIGAGGEVQPIGQAGFGASETRVFSRGARCREKGKK